MIEKVEFLCTVQCSDHAHSLLRRFLKEPSGDNKFACVLADMVRNSSSAAIHAGVKSESPPSTIGGAIPFMVTARHDDPDPDAGQYVKVEYYEGCIYWRGCPQRKCNLPQPQGLNLGAEIRRSWKKLFLCQNGIFDADNKCPKTHT
jgi:hypothetical protein